MNSIEMCITSRCNLDCRHCYQKHDKNQFLLPYEKIIEAINYGISHNVSHLIISGGEACLHPNYYDIIDFVILKTNLNLTLVTNGTIINTEFFKKPNFLKRINFVISIDGTKPNHEQRRGVGTYDKTLNTIKTLQDFGFNVKINVTLDENNFLDFPEILKNDDFKHITFLPVGFSGAAQENNMTSLNKDYEDLIKMIYEETEEASNYCRDCQLFPESLSLNYNGDIFPCSLARDFNLLKMGNIIGENIKTVIQNFIESEEGKNLLNTNLKDLPTCSACTHCEKCSKGCRIRALKYYHSLTAPDPFACKLHTNKFKTISFNKIYWGENA
ncbi:MAG: radical SAM protein [Clostridia bacterium]